MTSTPISSRFWTLASLALLLSVFLFSLYRASSQSLTHDEAYTSLAYVLSPLSDSLKYSANNHVLNTFLMRASVSLFGPSELSLRLPALLGAALYLSALFFILRLFLAPGKWFFLSLALASLNPLLLDFFACARGYSLALAFLFLAILFSLRCFAPNRSRHSFLLHSALVGVFLALSVSANLAFLFIALPVLITFFVLCAFSPRRNSAITPASSPDAPRRTGAKNVSAVPLPIGNCPLPIDNCSVSPPLAPSTPPLWRTLPALLLPALIILACVYLPYLSSIQSSSFYLGYSSWTDSAQDVLSASFLSAQTAVHVPADSPVPAIPGAILLAASVLCLVLLLLVALPLLAGLFREGLSDLSAHAALLLSLSSLLALVFYFLAHVAFGVKYPADRAVIYLVPLFALSLIAGLFVRDCRPRWLERIVLVFVLLVCVRYLTELHPSYFRSWLYDADSRAVARKVVVLTADISVPHTFILADWYNFPAADFYLRRHNVHPAILDRPLSSDLRLPRCLLLVGPSHDPRALPPSLAPLFTFPASGLTLYVRSSPSSP